MSKIFLYSLLLLAGFNTFVSASTSCGCCPLPRCNVRPYSCSSNIDCECLLMTATGAGLCANTVISCSTLAPCEADNKTCSISNTICVNNTRCGVPVCYPITLATPQICPPINSENNSVSATTTTLGSTSTSETALTTQKPTSKTTQESTSSKAQTTTITSTTATSTTTSTTATSKTTSTTATSKTTSTTATSTTTSTKAPTTTPNVCSNGTLCLNNGTCRPSESGYICICISPYYGSNCQNKGSSDTLSEVDRIINGSNVTYDRTVESVLNRNNWTNIVAVVDVTGSMLPCAAAVYKWLTTANNRDNRIKYYVFFNDGDNKPQANKTIGSTGGLYGTDTSDLNFVLNTMKTAMRNGNGGDIPENDIEALLYGIKQCPTCSNVVHIADNQATPRDLILLKNVSKPVKVLVCQVNNSTLNTKLMDIATNTTGSIHTIGQDVTNLSSIEVNRTIIVGSRTYKRTPSGYVLV